MMSLIGEINLVADSVPRSVICEGSSSVSIIVKDIGKGGVSVSNVPYREIGEQIE